MSCSRVCFIALISAALAACSEGVGLSTTLVTRIDHASLDPSGLRVSFTITNVGARTEDVPACGGQVSPRFQERSGTRWAEVGGGLCVAVFSAIPISLAADATVSGTAGLCCVGPGTYRLVVSYAPDGSPRAVSESFAVR